MNKQRAMQLQNETFRDGFDIERFARFIKELFNEIEINIQDKTPYIAKQFRDYIEEFTKIAAYRDASKKSMEILAVKLKRTSSRDRARTMQRNFVSSWLSKQDIDAALVAFYGDDDEDWRFSYVKMEYDLIEDEDGKVRVAKKLTPARRYSFLVGKNEPNHTCQRQFLDLIMEEERNPLISEIEQAFSIENVTNEFFERYKELTLNLKEALDRIVENDPLVRDEFERKGITTIDFSKKLLGQIVFLYFLQKKGWLGVQKGPDGRYREWGTGPKDFLRRLFEKKIVPYDNFFNDVLEPLFYHALATDRTPDHDDYGRLNCRIPFLNGGLFEAINDYDWVSTDITIPNELFSNSVETKEGDVGTGILDVFDRFNFTVKEDEPLEKEVAVDPEMLGKVFENLLEVKDRKSKGAFYTPREIVHYMCQQSLINYLETNTASVPREDIEGFILYGDVALDRTVRSLEEKRKYSGRSYVDENSVIPKSISENFREIDRLLRDIKIVDPAVGSGAFPVGMMNEIVKARSILSVFFPADEQAERTEYNLKRQCIENSLYGVDIEPSAVEIAKLRFWLSLIVDEEDIRKIKPLPNLDHKIMCGNSLLEEFEGVKLFDEKLLGEVPVKTPTEVEIEEIDARILRLNDQLRDIGLGSQPPEIQQKIEEREELKRRKKALERKLEMERRRPGDTQLTIDDASKRRIKESQEKLKEYKRLQKAFFNEQNRSRKKKLRQKMEDIEWELIEATLKEQGNEEAMQKLSQYKKNRAKPFFLWKLYFSEVFHRENPGFDVVIGNPPYIQLQKDHGKLAEQFENQHYETFDRRGDIYTLFYEKGLQLLKYSGVLTYITSNKWMRAGYGKKLRKFCIKYNPLILIDLGPGVFESATVDTNILIIQKAKNQNHLMATTYNDKNLSLDVALKRKGAVIEKLTKDAWFIGSKEEMALKEKIERIGTPLKDWDVKIYRGLLTGLNEAFIISTEKRNEILANCKTGEERKRTEEIIKPILRGRDIKRYYYDWAGLWVIVIPAGWTNANRGNEYADIFIEKRFPSLMMHLKQFEQKAKKRDDQGDYWWELRHCAYYPEFEKEKVVWKRIGSVIRFSYDTEGMYSLDSNVIMTGKNIKYLCGYLNSKLSIKQLLENSPKTGTGDVIISVQALNPHKIPPITPSNQGIVLQIEGLVDQILSTKKQNPQADTNQLEKQIDQLVYKLYGLTPEEIRIVEEFTAEHQSKKSGKRGRKRKN